MPSLKDLKNRIKSVKSTQKITKAMKMVAAAKLRRAKEQAEAARPYAEAMEKLVAALASSINEGAMAPPMLRGTGRDEVHLLLVATSDRGLCGAFNSSIVRATRRKARELLAQGKTLKMICVGRKGFEQLQSEFKPYMIGRQEIKGKRVAYEDAARISTDIAARFDAGEFDVATVVYNHFKSAISQTVTFQQLIPLLVARRSSLAEEQKSDERRATGDVPYDYEPEEEEILAEMLPKNLGIQMYKSLLENAASEQGARMTAMDNATRNAGDMIKKLGIRYNRTRQAAITKELIEIISGAEAV